MHEGSFFVDVKNVWVEYSEKIPLTKRLTGHKPVTSSVLRNVNMSLQQGAWVTVYGASGSGKSTLLRLLTGILTPSRGQILVNGHTPTDTPQLAAGYVSADESEVGSETAHQILQAFCETHDIPKPAERIGVVTDALEISALLPRLLSTLSFTERLKVNLAKGIISDTPLLLLDDVADELGIEYVRKVLLLLCKGRTVIISTRFPATAQTLDLPIVLLYGSTLAHFGTQEAIADSIAVPRIVDVWVEGLRYDLLRQLRRHTGVSEVRLLPTDQFNGQHIRITLQSSRYLPAMYDMVSQAPLIKIEEFPPSLTDILAKL